VQKVTATITLKTRTARDVDWVFKLKQRIFLSTADEFVDVVQLLMERDFFTPALTNYFVQLIELSHGGTLTAMHRARFYDRICRERDILRTEKDTADAARLTRVLGQHQSRLALLVERLREGARAADMAAFWQEGRMALDDVMSVYEEARQKYLFLIPSVRADTEALRVALDSVAAVVKSLVGLMNSVPVA
jgi:hypothetical protein